MAKKVDPLVKHLQTQLKYAKKNRFGPIVCIERDKAEMLLERITQGTKSTIQVLNLPDDWIDVELDDDDSFGMSDYIGAERFRLK